MKKPSIASAIDGVLNDFLQVQKDISKISGLYGTVMKEVESTLIKKIMTLTDKNKKQAAKILGISRNTLSTKIKLLDLEKD